MWYWTINNHTYQRLNLSDTVLASLSLAPASLTLAPACLSLSPSFPSQSLSCPDRLSLAPASLSLTPAQSLSCSSESLTLALASLSLAPASLSLAPAEATPQPHKVISAVWGGSYCSRRDTQLVYWQIIAKGVAPSVILLKEIRWSHNIWNNASLIIQCDYE
jgi:hypothetical protein